MQATASVAVALELFHPGFPRILNSYLAEKDGKSFSLSTAMLDWSLIHFLSHIVVLSRFVIHDAWAKNILWRVCLRHDGTSLNYDTRSW